MAQHDYNIANQSGAAFRADLNNALLAIVSQNSGISAPGTTFAHQFWADTTTGTLKIRNAANSAWIELMQLDGTLTMEDGTALLPGLAFRDDLNTGLFSDAADTLGISTGGVERVEFGTTATVFNDGGADVDFRIEGDTNANLFFVDAGNDRIGLGTSSPTALLTVSSGEARFDLNATNASGRLWNIYSGGGGNVGAGAFAIAEGGATQRFLIIGGGTGEAMRIDALNRVGIGTTSPSAKLTITESGNVSAIDIRSADSNASLLSLGVNTSAGVSYIQSNSTGSGTLRSLAFYGASTEWGRFDTSGRLLVGTSSRSDSAKLVVQGNTSSGSDGGIIALSSIYGASIGGSGTYVGQIKFTDSQGGVFGNISCQADGVNATNDYPGRLVFSTTADGASSPTERMRINNAGGILIGTGLHRYTSRLVVDADGTNVGATFHQPLTSTYTAIFFSNPNGAVGNITTNGSSTTYNTSSDYRLKENVVPLTGAVDRLNQLQVHRFNFIADPDKTFDGFLAHEAQAVVPECVTGEKDAVDDEGNPVYQGIDQSKLVPLLTAALQEALAKIETLEQRLSDAGIA